MAVVFDLPEKLEEDLRRRLGDLNHEAKEAALVELFRQEKLSHRQLSEALGISRLETDAILKKHNVTEDLPTGAEIELDVQNLRRLLNSK